jgi:hypothetical protein
MSNVLTELPTALATAVSQADSGIVRVEEQDRYILRIEWDSVEGHLAGFRRAPEFTPFLAAIKPYISRIEEMQHYTPTSVVSSKRK